MMLANKKEKDYLRSFGRVRGKKLPPGQQYLVDNMLPDISVYVRKDGSLDCKAKLENYRSIALEIGFGAGEHLLALAKAKPDCLVIGAEPFMNGVAKCLRRLDEQALPNVRLYTGDVRDILTAMPDAFLSSIYILFPDPWPKVRHHKRRLISQAFLQHLARVQQCGGILQLATDHLDYSAWMLEHVLATPYYDWQVRSEADWRTPPGIWQETKYQRKTTKEGRAPMFFACKRSDVALAPAKKR